MAIELPDVIRGVSGVLWVTLGIALLVRGRQAQAKLLGVFFVSIAPDFVGFNVMRILGLRGGVPFAIMEIAASVTEAVGALALLFAIRAELRSNGGIGRRAAKAGVLAAIVAAIAFSIVGPLGRFGADMTAAFSRFSSAAVSASETLSFILLGTYGLVLALRARRDSDAGLAWLAAGLVVFPGVRAIDNALAFGPSVRSVLVSAPIAIGFLITGLALSAPFLAATVVLCGVRARAPAWFPRLALPLGMQALVLVTLGAESTFGDSVGVSGIARLLAFAMVGYALLRFDPYGEHAPASRSRRVVIAPFALALLFIVAQITQNFFAAAYGLIMGGIVAGAFLFAASPIQRAMERVGDRGRGPTDVARGPAAAEESYLLALRLAFRDRVLSREEERGLVVLAHDLGIAPRRAHELQDQVEREMEVR